jgi:hypothetical protein
LECSVGEVFQQPSHPRFEKLAKLAAGRCIDEERPELIKLLEQKADLIPVLARETRILRRIAVIDRLRAKQENLCWANKVWQRT